MLEVIVLEPNSKATKLYR